MKAEPGKGVVIDTNVWISAFLMKTGAPAAVVRNVITPGRPVFSLQTFAELEARLWLPKFDRYLGMDDRKLLLQDASALAHWVEVPPALAVQKFCRDADDDKFIRAALAYPDACCGSETAGVSRLNAGRVVSNALHGHYSVTKLVI